MRASRPSCDPRMNSACGWSSRGKLVQGWPLLHLGPALGRQLKLRQSIHQAIIFLLAAVDRQDAVRRDVPDRLGELEVILVVAPLPLGEFFALGGGRACRCPRGRRGRPRGRRPFRRSCSAMMCPTPASTSSGVFSSFSGLSRSAAISARLATAGSRFQTAAANGSRPRSRADGSQACASWACRAGTGLPAVWGSRRRRWRPAARRSACPGPRCF